MNTLSLLGSGWLGFPLALNFIKAGYRVNVSTTSEDRIANLKSIGANPFIVNIDSLTNNVQHFFQSKILIVNIPSKSIENFRNLVNRIEGSDIQKVLFVSSISVYENKKRSITESDTEYFTETPLLEIEKLFQHNRKFQTTIVRFGGLIGYSRHPGHFINLKKVVQNPDSPVNLIHQDDCIGIIKQIVEQQVWGEIFNCCADTHPTKKEFYMRAVNLMGGSPPEFGETDARFGKIIKNNKVKQLLNYKFKHPDLMKIDFNESI
ncbi:NAD(P)-dependent oxidoreductase [bacterium (Candidatus Blackallbacteria) CG17_big_fil_post_rev_8_21_14_2_50_48_46]|uniref:NAD(P)-dependent oxidoreductase n=1 Tax=bacterium (Candidatus Blackallbacteria) CG17_big_fil_post_rev_8_21_14_2_50_48_46 TaxID=2014261 RepID=A0A2M7G1D4_9BACT|nr:MAG: NAD(P)-dependent oxidoreductase [bacterium (Candidatus Blackallbacteria) CG18_big_fil_WC_8_21_14_2_50_49_26]PIW15525.1 MAG: NAD(P)-dependent oxidoreductase [bacterium (Candidatus Blackallbacteria) CG17_big_fil_post_rev_8_21_14_2_50_48_46]PIW48574.1 MAG: NAD(P)-dependent oxidoreductase [bacterium (Candidatus Blackallbacteria) CG13_big_fil_rev_8_21_14_2_50_49_14]